MDAKEKLKKTLDALEITKFYIKHSLETFMFYFDEQGEDKEEIKDDLLTTLFVLENAENNLKNMQKITEQTNEELSKTESR